MPRKTRKFEDHQAVRSRVAVMLGLIGPSGSGKTKSALRLATGIVRITGGKIYVVDTEQERAAQYAPKKGEKAKPPATFDFLHVPFEAPFSPLDYLDAFNHCAAKRDDVVITDSMSHEHEGPGGVLEWHDKEVDRLAELWKKNPGEVGFAAWSKPKQARQRLINTVVQLGVNSIFCFRAKEKTKPKGRDMEDLGWQPIAGDEFYYELPTRFLLYPGAEGVPTWKVDKPGERHIVRLADFFEPIFEETRQLDEKHGEAMATWARGDEPVAEPLPSKGPAQLPKATGDDLIDIVSGIVSAQDGVALSAAADEGRRFTWSKEARSEISVAYKNRLAQLKERD